MSTYEYRPNGENTFPIYPIGTEGWQFSYGSGPNNVLDSARDYTLAAIRIIYPGLGVIPTVIAGAIIGDGAWCPTYGLWAGPGWSAGTRTPEGGDIDWEKLPCYNNNIKNIENNPELNPDDCISLVDAITKTHDWRYVRPLKSIHMLRCAAVLGVATYTKSTPHFSGFARLASERI
ncbi:MAG TPA: hypothetical protein PLX58_03050 [Smithellaceae bacterium]|jgi:hypothetical protein|nr:hypothetical protein [Smithellaceae bacterium]HQG80447.1 hypothetical protein [Smithellaceae bacterium]